MRVQFKLPQRIVSAKCRLIKCICIADYRLHFKMEVSLFIVLERFFKSTHQSKTILLVSIIDRRKVLGSPAGLLDLFCDTWLKKPTNTMLHLLPDLVLKSYQEFIYVLTSEKGIKEPFCWQQDGDKNVTTSQITFRLTILQNEDKIVT